MTISIEFVIYLGTNFVLFYLSSLNFMRRNHNPKPTDFWPNFNMEKLRNNFTKLFTSSEFTTNSKIFLRKEGKNIGQEHSYGETYDFVWNCLWRKLFFRDCVGCGFWLLLTKKDNNLTGWSKRCQTGEPPRKHWAYDCLLIWYSGNRFEFWKERVILLQTFLTKLSRSTYRIRRACLPNKKGSTSRILAFLNWKAHAHG